MTSPMSQDLRTLLPPARERATGQQAPYLVATVCLGNICRSPMAAAVLTDRIEGAGLADRVRVVSAGTGDWHVGAAMDRRAAEVLTTQGYVVRGHRARQVDEVWLGECDLVLAMDADNYRALDEMAGAALGDRLRMFRDFDPLLTASSAHGTVRDVPDPYYGQDEGFTTVLTIVERTSEALVAALAATLDGSNGREAR
ncbi:MAG TPA: low molecular weight protein-tyrosine-phosphatase [Nocardioidaceae bacterium]|nr:low molecular weight protein-tyrosine-phosphatase [Nocardioidaceae bacterium]